MMRSALALGALATLATATDLADKIAKIRMAPTENARNALILDSERVFDFLAPDAVKASGKGGFTVSANGANFPGVVAQGFAATLGFLGPCGINTPHVHPRSPEFAIVTAGGPLLTQIATENNGKLITNELQLGQATVFPQGAIHYQQNLGCSPAQFVAVFRSEDPGTGSVAQRFFDLDVEVQRAVLGYPAAQELLDLANKTQANIAFGTEECLRRCGIDPANLPQTELDQRFLLEAALEGRTDVFKNGFKPSPGSGASAPKYNDKQVSHNAKQLDDSESATVPRVYLPGGESFWNDAEKLKTAFIATLATSMALALALVVVAIVALLRRRRRTRQAIHRKLADADAVLYSRDDDEDEKRDYRDRPFTPPTTQ